MRTIIVGGGLAGLWLAEQLAKRGDRVTLFEKDRLGGRIITSAANGYEIGAARIASTHRRVLALVRRFGLTTYTHSRGSRWMSLRGDSYENDFSEIWAAVLRLIRQLDPDVLATHTLRELADRILGPKLTESILQKFPYRAETETLRADLGILTFDGDMAGSTKFMGVVGGLSQIIKGLAAGCRAAGVRIRIATVVDIIGNAAVLADGSSVVADRVVLALPVTALRKMSCTRDLPLLRRIAMKPLTRVYASTTLRLKERVVTDSPLRFIIPIRDDVVMISYVESQDTKPLLGLTGDALVRRLTTEVRRLFPGTEIAWAKAYEWHEGCSYWLPGRYDPAEASVAAYDVAGVHLCGESFSLHQAWMEGALDHAAGLLDYLKRGSV